MAKIAPAYNLPCKRIIHTVGPIANGSPNDLNRAQLASCYASCFSLAAGEGLASIAFYCIGTGVFGFPQREAAQIAVRAFFCMVNPTSHAYPFSPRDYLPIRL